MSAIGVHNPPSTDSTRLELKADQLQYIRSKSHAPKYCISAFSTSQRYTVSCCSYFTAFYSSWEVWDYASTCCCCGISKHNPSPFIQALPCTHSTTPLHPTCSMQLYVKAGSAQAEGSSATQPAAPHARPTGRPAHLAAHACIAPPYSSPCSCPTLSSCAGR